MENDILELLEDVGYSGPLLDASRLEKALDGGPKCLDFTDLVAWMSQELKSFCKLEEHVSPITSPEDSSAFLLELSSFLKELCCPYIALTEGHVNDRFQNKGSCVQLLTFLLSELQAARMVEATKPDLGESLRVEVIESSTASDLKGLLMALSFPKPPDNITPGMLFGKVEAKVKEVVARAPPELIGKPLFVGLLSETQWQTVANVQSELQEEYRMRRQMLLKRLDVTVQSFQWSDKAKKRQDEIALLYRKRRETLAEVPKVSLADLLSAREDLAILEKTSGSAVRKNTQCAINRVLIGAVPDRGGRTSEQPEPPPEMPSWQQRSAGPQGGGGGWRGGGGGGGYRGGRGGGDQGGGGGGRNWSSKGERVQGNWNPPNRDYQQNDSQGGGGGGYNQGGGYRGGRGGRGGGGYRGNRGGRGRDRNNY